MRFYPLLFLCVLFPACTPLAAQAGASLLVDDAEITPRGECQLESWVRQHRNGSAMALVPACTLAGTEWSLGLGHHSGDAQTLWTAGVKRPLPLPANSPVQLALSLGAERDLHDPQTHALILSLPSTWQLDERAQTLLHVEVGRQHDARHRGWIGGIGVEQQLTSQWTALGELARDLDRQQHLQFGLRRQMAAGHSLDLLYGRSLRDSRDRWLTLGLNLPLSY